MDMERVKLISLIAIIVAFFLGLYLGNVNSDLFYRAINNDCAKNNNVYKCKLIAVPVEVE